jgi:hypothetical protein
VIKKSSVRPNKIKVLVLRQRRPLKILADGTFLLPNRKKKKKSSPRRIFEENKNSNLPPNLSFQACR